MVDIIVTMPDTKKEGIKKLIKFYKRENGFIYFKLPFFPKKTDNRDRCYIVSDGMVIGSHRIQAITELSDGEAAELSDGNWTGGKYVIRDASTFKELKNKIKLRGFQGFRYADKIPGLKDGI